MQRTHPDLQRMPAHIQAVVSYALSFPNIMPLLQSELQPFSACIGQASPDTQFSYPKIDNAHALKVRQKVALTVSKTAYGLVHFC